MVEAAVTGGWPAVVSVARCDQVHDVASGLQAQRQKGVTSPRLSKAMSAMRTGSSTGAPTCTTLSLWAAARNARSADDTWTPQTRWPGTLDASPDVVPGETLQRSPMACSKPCSGAWRRTGGNMAVFRKPGMARANQEK